MAVNHADGMIFTSVIFCPIAAAVGAAHAGAGWLTILFIPVGLAAGVGIIYVGRKLVYAITGFGNNSSVILLFKDNNERFLFTSDAGVPALTGAVEVANRIGVDLSTVKGLQVPHHGSKHNVGPAILNLIVGPKKAAEQITKSAIVSAPKKGEPRHPSKKVVNAFIRRGAKVVATQGKTICFHGADTPVRKDWVSADVLPFSNQVEE